MCVLCCVTFHLLCGLTNTLSLARPSAPPQLWVSWQSALVPLRLCFYKATNAGRSTEVRSLDCSICTSGPSAGAVEAAQTLACPGLRSSSCPFRCSTDWIHKASRGGVNLWFVRLWGEISALLSKSHDPWRLSCDFTPTSVGGQPTSVYSQGCWGSGQSAGACLGGPLLEREDAGAGKWGKRLQWQLHPSLWPAD